MRVLEVQWSRTLSLVCQVALISDPKLRLVREATRKTYAMTKLMYSTHRRKKLMPPPHGHLTLANNQSFP
jgi:hypothetical protein